MEGFNKKAIIVGCNYPNMPELRLNGCYTDAMSMREMLINQLSFPMNNIVLLMDNPGSPIIPTHVNIMMALTNMINQARPGDVLCFHYAGHGGLLGNNIEAIFPTDLNPITKMDFRWLVSSLPRNVTFTVIADSCNSGGLIDKEPLQIGLPPPVGRMGSSRKLIPVQDLVQHFSRFTGLNSSDLGLHLRKHFGPGNCSILYRMPRQLPPPLTEDQGILLSGCQWNELSDEGINARGEPCGLFTNALVEIEKANARRRSLLNAEIIIKARKVLANTGHLYQHPCLYCSKGNADKGFLG